MTTPQCRQIVRPATIADASAVHALIRAAWKDRYPPESSGNWISVQEVAHLLHEGGGFVLDEGGTAIGSVLWAHGDGCLELMKLALLPSRAGSGLSPQLMAAVEQQARILNHGEVRLAVRAGNPPLLRFYERHGYVVDTALTYAHANPRSAPPDVMRKALGAAGE